MKLRRITINGEYNLKNVDLDLRNDCALLVGANGSGKTNIIKCIAAMLKFATAAENDMFVELTSGDMRLKDPSIKLYFDLNKNERKEIMKLRMMYVIDKTIQLCKPLVAEDSLKSYNSYRSLPKVTKFRQSVIPQLLEVFKASCERLGDWHSTSSNDAEVIISYHDMDRGQKTLILKYVYLRHFHQVYTLCYQAQRLELTVQHVTTCLQLQNMSGFPRRASKTFVITSEISSTYICS